jgi:high-affinity nickel-transport protein
VVLAAGSASSPVLALGYVLLFGLGSILGMTTLSVVLSAPLAVSAGRLARFSTGLQALVGLATLGIGARLAYALLL